MWKRVRCEAKLRFNRDFFFFFFLVGKTANSSDQAGSFVRYDAKWKMDIWYWVADIFEIFPVCPLSRATKRVCFGKPWCGYTLSLWFFYFLFFIFFPPLSLRRPTTPQPRRSGIRI